MIKCDGFKAFRGAARVTPVNGKPPFDVVGDWIYKPDTGCWYVQPKGDFSWSFPREIVSDIQEEVG